MIDQFSHYGIGWRTSVMFVNSHWSVLASHCNKEEFHKTKIVVNKKKGKGNFYKDSCTADRLAQLVEHR